MYEFIGNSDIDNYALLSYFDGQGGYDQSVTNLGGQYKSGYELNHPGTWTLQSSPVPEPASYLLFILGLSVLGFVLNRRA